jgi:hypothetical protein
MRQPEYLNSDSIAKFISSAKRALLGAEIKAEEQNYSRFYLHDNNKFQIRNCSDVQFRYHREQFYLGSFDIL